MTSPAELVAKWEQLRAAYLPDSSVKADTVFTEIISDLMATAEGPINGQHTRERGPGDSWLLGRAILLI